MKTTDKTENERLKAVREAQKRLAWIENVKRVKGYTQEQAEKAWAKIFNQQSNG